MRQESEAESIALLRYHIPPTGVARGAYGIPKRWYGYHPVDSGYETYGIVLSLKS